MTELEKRHSKFLNLWRESWENDAKIRKEQNRPFYVSYYTIRYQEIATWIQHQIIQKIGDTK